MYAGTYYHKSFSLYLHLMKAKREGSENVITILTAGVLTGHLYYPGNISTLDTGFLADQYVNGRVTIGYMYVLVFMATMH